MIFAVQSDLATLECMSLGKLWVLVHSFCTQKGVWGRVLVLQSPSNYLNCSKTLKNELCGREEWALGVWWLMNEKLLARQPACKWAANGALYSERGCLSQR